MKKITLLIVEDHEVTRVGLCNALGAEADFIVVGSCDNSDDAIHLCQERQPDLILLDLHLPGSMGPRSMVEKFCGLKCGQVIIFSSENRKAFIDVVLNAGAADFINKSESIQTIIAKLRTIANLSRKTNSALTQIKTKTNLKLTETELHLLTLFANGLKYQDIAKLRHTSQSTVRKQCELLLEKLQLATREELIAWAAHNGYGSLDKQLDTNL